MRWTIKAPWARFAGELDKLRRAHEAREARETVWAATRDRLLDDLHALVQRVAALEGGRAEADAALRVHTGDLQRLGARVEAISAQYGAAVDAHGVAVRDLQGALTTLTAEVSRLSARLGAPSMGDPDVLDVDEAAVEPATPVLAFVLPEGPPSDVAHGVAGLIEGAAMGAEEREEEEA